MVGSGMTDRTLSKILGDFVDHFVPATWRAQGPQREEQARLAIGICFFMTFVFLVLTLIHAFAGSRLEAGLNALLALMLAAAPVIVRVTGAYLSVFNAVLTVAVATLSVIAVRSRGGDLSAATVGIAEVPLFATLIGGARMGALWTVLGGAAIGVVGVLTAAGYASEAIPVEARLFDEYATIAVVMVTLFLVALLFDARARRGYEKVRIIEQDRRRAEREKLEAVAETRLAHAERLAAMGRIAAATAHEINNPLAFVAGNLEYLGPKLREIDAPDELHDAVAESLNGANRIRDIVDDMRGLARQDEERIADVDLAGIVATALRMADVATRNRARVRNELGVVPRVEGNESRLVQVFLNLIVNAADAIEEGQRDSNEIVVSGRVVDGAVEVCVRDTGRGIPPEIVERVTEPFFTTKPVGKGTGLGLALAFSMVRRFGGELRIESAPGKTEVTVSLPVARVDSQALESAASPDAATVPPAQPPLARQRVLVIDDEPNVCRFMRRALVNHDVVTCTGGAEALALLARDPDFDLILCDLTMPNVSGMAVFERLQAEQPELAERVVLMTGGDHTERARMFRDTVPNQIVGKPVTIERLLELLRAIASTR